jgi:hypothetical protein
LSGFQAIFTTQEEKINGLKGEVEGLTATKKDLLAQQDSL